MNSSKPIQSYTLHYFKKQKTFIINIRACVIHQTTELVAVVKYINLRSSSR